MKLTFFLFFVVLSIYSTAQQIKIKGNVFNEKNEPISYAIVKIKNDSLGVAKKFVLTDSKGSFEVSFNNSLSTRFWLEISCVGYFTYIKQIQVHDEKNPLPSITLIENKKLPDVFVKSEKPIKINGDTTTFKVSEFVKGNEKNLNDLLTNMPGFTINNSGKISFNGKQVDKVLIENDDLLGSNYEKVTNNLGINGIEKVEVIDNFEDNESIISSFNNQSKKQVVNLKYQKNKLFKVFGETELGSNITQHNTKLQLISLIKKLKSVSISGINNIGNLYNNKEEEMPIGINPELDLINVNLSPKQSIASINENEIKPLNNVVSNNSTLATGNFLLKPIQNLNLKIKTNYTKNRYLKRFNSQTTNFLPDTSINFNATTENWFSKEIFSNEFLANYIVKKSQFIFNIQTTNQNTANTGTGSFQLNNLNEKQGFSKNDFFVKLHFSSILSNKLAITSFVQLSQHSLNGNYYVSPSLMSGFFNKNILFGNVLQNETQNTKNKLLGFKLYYNESKHKTSLSILFEDNQSNINNGITLTNSISETLFVSNDSLIFNNLNIKELKFTLEDAWSFRKNIKLNYGLTFLKRNIQNFNIYKNQETNTIENNFNPFVSATVNIKKNKRFFVTFSLQNRMQSLKDFGGGFKIENLSTIGKNIDSFISKNNQGLTIIYSNIDFSSKKMILFSGFSYNIIPYINISNFNFKTSFNIKEQVESSRNLTVYNYFFRMDKYSKNMVYKFSPEFNISYSKVYNILNKIENENNNLNIRGSLGFDYKPNKDFSITTKFEYNIFGSGSVNTNFPLQLNAQEIKYQLDFNVKITNLISLFQSNNIYNFKSGNQFSNTIYISNLRLDFKLLKNKLSSDFSISNIFNIKDYTRNVITPIQVFKETHFLFPRLLMLNFKYLF